LINYRGIRAIIFKAAGINVSDTKSEVRNQTPVPTKSVLANLKMSNFKQQLSHRSLSQLNALQPVKDYLQNDCKSHKSHLLLLSND
jgi:hypothetical protein